MIDKEKYITKREMTIIKEDISEQAKKIYEKISDKSLYRKKDLASKVCFMKEGDGSGDE